MFDLLILSLVALAGIAISCRYPRSIFVFLILAAPYYGFTKSLIDPESLLVAWKDVLLAALLIGTFLRLHGRLRCTAAFLILLAYCAVSASISTDWQSGALGFRATCQWMLLALAASSLRDPELTTRVGRALIWSGTIVSATYIIERTFFFTQDDIALAMGIRAEERWKYNNVLDRFSLIYGNPNALAVFLVICACFAFGWYMHKQSGRTRTLLLVCGLTCVAGVLFTASRGALPALAVALLILGRGASKKTRRVIIVGALAASVFLINPQLLSQRLDETSSSDFTSSYRYQAWTGTVDRALSSYQLLLVGSGLGTYGGYVSDRSGISDVITENQYFKILGEQGVIGLALMLVLIVRMRGPGAEIRSSGEAAVPAAIAAVLVYCLVGNILDGMIVAVPFWTLVGIRLTPLRERKPARNPSPARQPRWSAAWA